MIQQQITWPLPLSEHTIKTIWVAHVRPEKCSYEKGKLHETSLRLVYKKQWPLLKTHGPVH